jgi:hypothetical protein
VTDIMCCGYYPHDPVPGPREKPTVHDWVMAHAPKDYDPIPNLPWLIEKNPIREDPMFFPGNAWKGTSGMPQGRFL